MAIRRLALRLRYPVPTVVLLVFGLCSPRAFAQHSDAHAAASVQDARGVNALVQAVRDATRRFQNPAVALAEGYVPQFGCVTGSSEGVMGVHFVNGGLVGDGVLDVAQPEILVYEPLPNGAYRLVAVDYLVLKSAWDANNPAPPELMGQLFHFFESPNRFGLPEFYTLHVWAWKENPQGTFANWNPNVSCDAYNPAP